MRLTDKVAVVTGGYGTLARAIAKGLKDEGARVALLGRDEHKLALAASAFESNVTGVTADVLDQKSLQAAADHVVELWGTVDILVNCAGGNDAGAIVSPDQSLFDLEEDAWDRVVDLNLKGTLLPILAFAKPMSEQRQGSIINISSMAASQALTRVAGYSAAKGGVESLTRWLAIELINKFGPRLRINAVAPGFFIGDQNRALLLNDDGSLTERGQTIVDQTPMRRFGQPGELCGAINWLASDEASFVTGTIIPVDGGFGAFSGV